MMWKPEYSLNLTEIDAQHRQLFSLLGDLLDIANRRDGLDHYDEIVAVFDELSNYTVKHFAYEEQLMIRYGYPAAAQKMHQFEHGGFVNKVTQIRQQDLDKNEQGILKDIINFVANWIEQHILETDKQYVPFFKEKGVC